MRQFALLLVMTMFMQISAAWACECAEITEESSLAIIEKAALIFEGTITSMEERKMPEEDFDYESQPPVPENPFFAKVRLKVVDLYKGAPEGRRVEAYVDVMTSCGYMYQPGDFAAFILNNHEGVLVQADLCNTPLPAHWEMLKEGKFKE